MLAVEAGIGKVRKTHSKTRKNYKLTTNMQKKLLLTAVAAMMSAVALADIPESAVPAAVVNGVKTAYPKAGPIEWDKDGVVNKYYEAEFRVDGFKYDVHLTPEGKIVRVKEDIAISALPEAVSAAAVARVPGSKIKDAEKITEGDLIRYEVEVIDNTGEDTDLDISADGKVLRVDR